MRTFRLEGEVGIKLVPFRVITTDSQYLDRVQINIETAFKPLLASEILNSVLLEDVALTTGVDNLINHKLGRKVRGWILTRVKSQATVWDLQDANLSPELTLVLRSSANVTVSLLVF